MTIKGVDFVKMTDEEIEALFSVPDPNCGICNKPIKPSESIQYTRDSINTNKMKLTHEDCYYDEFSKELDKHPIGVPRMHQGYAVSRAIHFLEANQ